MVDPCKNLLPSSHRGVASPFDLNFLFFGGGCLTPILRLTLDDYHCVDIAFPIGLLSMALAS